MSRKCLISLAPLTVFAALAVTPVAAQAAGALVQKWHHPGRRQTDSGRELGRERQNLSQTSAIGEINCRGVGGGTIENPTGGGAGKGQTWESTFFECKSAGCEKAAERNGTPVDVIRHDLE